MFSIYRSYWELKRKLTRCASEGLERPKGVVTSFITSNNF